MKEFNLIFKYSLSKAGVKRIKLRSGSFGLAEVPLELLLPFIVIYLNITSRVASARLVVEGRVEVNKKGMHISFIDEPVIVNNDLYSAIIISIKEQLTDMDGEADFTQVEDAMYRFIESQNSDDSFSYDEAVNEMMTFQYKEILKNVGGPLSMALELEKNSGELSNEF